MSETGSKKNVKSLLPPSRVEIFTAHEKLLKHIDALNEDWRFARVNLNNPGYTLDDALDVYKTRRSPHLLIIHTDSIDEAFQANLGKLSEVCSEGTSAVVVGPVNDVQLYRNLMAMGVSDYLLQDIELEDFVTAISSVLLDALGATDSQLISVIGAKGGVGASVVSEAISLALCDELGQKVIVMDAAAGHSTQWSNFGFSPNSTVIEAAKAVADRDTESLDRMIHKVNDRLHVLNSGAEPMLDNPVSDKAYNMIMDKMLVSYPHVVVDLSGATTLLQREVLSRSHAVFVVTSPTLPSLSMTRLLMKEVSDMRGGDADILRLVVNKSGENSSSDVSVKDIKESLDVKNAISIGYDAKTFGEVDGQGKLLSAVSGGKKVISQFVGPLREILDITAPSDDKKQVQSSSGLMKFLKK